MRVFAEGEVQAGITPELFLFSRRQFYARDASVPEAGLTMAVGATRKHQSRGAQLATLRAWT